MLGDDINKLLEGGYYQLCQDCMGHLLPDSGDINILEINIDMFLCYIILYYIIYLYWDTNWQKSMAKKKPNPRSIDMYRYSKWRVLFHYVDHMKCKIKDYVWFGYLLWTTDPDQARGGLLLWWKKLNKIPFLVQTHKEATPLLNNRWTSSGNWLCL
jgi:hypothetical protein